MMGQLITLPLRLSACTASFVLRSSEEVLKRALSLTGRAVEAEPRYSGRPPVARDAAPPGIDEPWEGYSRLGAKAVIARLRDADSAELAAVNLYESAHRTRQTVLSAVERQLAARGNAPN
jgi:hypothetical protein